LVFIGESDGPLETGIDLAELDFVGDCLFGEGSAAKLFSCFEITGDRVGLLEVVDETL